MNRSIGESMPISEKREACEIMGRELIAKRIEELGSSMKKASYKDIMYMAGQIYCLALGSTYDDYWQEKMFYGVRKEEHLLSQIIEINQNKEERR